MWQRSFFGHFGTIKSDHKMRQVTKNLIPEIIRSKNKCLFINDLFFYISIDYYLGYSPEAKVRGSNPLGRAIK